MRQSEAIETIPWAKLSQWRLKDSNSGSNERLKGFSCLIKVEPNVDIWDWAKNGYLLLSPWWISKVEPMTDTSVWAKSRYFCRKQFALYAYVTNASFEVEPIGNIKVEPIADIKTEPIVDIGVEPIADIKVEPIVDIKVETIVDIEVEPIVDIKVEPIVDI